MIKFAAIIFLPFQWFHYQFRTATKKVVEMCENFTFAIQSTPIALFNETEYEFRQFSSEITETIKQCSLL